MNSCLQKYDKNPINQNFFCNQLIFRIKCEQMLFLNYKYIYIIVYFCG